MNSKKRIAQDVFELVSRLYKEGNSIDSINKILKDSYGYSEDYINRSFRYRYGDTLNDHLNKMKLMDAYDSWISDGGETLTSRSEIKGIKEFKKKFRNTFGFSPEEAQKENIDLSNFIVDEEMVRMLENSDWIEGFRIYKGNVSVRVDVYKMILYYLKTPVFVFPLELIMELNYKEAATYERIILFASLIAGEWKNEEQEPLLQVKKEALMRITELLIDYNIDNPEIIEDKCFFHIIYPDNLELQFKKEINRILNEELMVNVGEINYPILNDFMRTYERCSGFTTKSNKDITVEQLLKYSSYSKEDLLENIWSLFKTGVLRVTSEL